VTINRETEHNDTPNAAKVNDGGFYYSVTAGGQSASGSTREGGLQSYGSMTYAGLKSMIDAGLEPDDPRVKAAVKWIGDHYTVNENNKWLEGDANLVTGFALLALSYAKPQSE
jgi:squalene-hopene/tetraprenyl-beta-curcumene cyclase